MITVGRGVGKDPVRRALSSNNNMATMLVMNDIDDPRLDLNLLAVFDALLRERSVTRAGQSLGLSQSSISHALGRLRTFFDDPLFIKGNRGVTPSPKAEALAADIIEIMGAIRSDILAQAKFDAATMRRTFTLALSDMGEMVVIPPLLERMALAAPLCTINTIQVMPDSVETVLATGEADLAIHSLGAPSEILYQQALNQHGFVSIVSARNTSLGATLGMAEFEAMPHLVVRLSGRGKAPYDRAIDDAGVTRRILVSTPHFLFVPMLLDSQPDMIATIPRVLGRTFEDYGMVRTYEPPLALPSFTLRQYWHPRFHHDQANRWLRQSVRAAVEAHPPH